MCTHQDNLQAIFLNSCKALEGTNKIRLAHALEVIVCNQKGIVLWTIRVNVIPLCAPSQTICVVLKSIFRKKFSSFGVEVIDVLCKKEQANELFVKLISNLHTILTDSHEYSGKAILSSAFQLFSSMVIQTLVQNKQRCVYPEVPFSFAKQRHSKLWH